MQEAMERWLSRNKGTLQLFWLGDFLVPGFRLDVVVNLGLASCLIPSESRAAETPENKQAAVRSRDPGTGGESPPEAPAPFKMATGSDMVPGR
ncbi:unnamed protein product [Gadus morhua 'NCC']